jgi:hypothetical protein
VRSEMAGMRAGPIGQRGLLGLCLIGICAAMLASASLASAAPEIGRCVKVEGMKEGTKTVYNGGYKSKTCRTSSATHTGKYEWLAGAGESKGYEAISDLPLVLETTSGTKIECAESQSFGEYTGAKSEKASFFFSGCAEAGTKAVCTTETPVGEELPKESLIRTQALTGELGLVEGTKHVGWDVKPEVGSTVTTFECGAKLTGKQYVIEGSLVDRIRGTNRMREETHEIYKQASGKQRPEELEGGAPDVLSAKFLVGAELKTEAIGLGTIEEHNSEEELEYRVSSS